MKSRTIHRCTDCGADHPKWQGRCESCGAWNTLVEEIVARNTRRTAVRTGDQAPKAAPVTIGSIGSTASARVPSGIGELDFVLGGGIVTGSMILVGGEPGIGKSTLLLQLAGALSAGSSDVLYVSAEESGLQVRMRSERLGTGDAVSLLCETRLESILAVAADVRPDCLIVDSIQTISTEELEGAPGNVGQVRECAARLMRFAKSSGTAVIVVGHVTKGGTIAGPRTLEHIVDTVLYFEGEGSLDHRVLRSTKNRFGSVDEIAVFRMTGQGLEGVPNPSALFMGHPDQRPTGSATTALMEGTRPLLVEIQALATRAGYGTPQRVAAGLDGRRLALLLAVLEKRAGLPFGQLDVFVNVVGGLRMSEPSGDLAVAAALASSVRDTALAPRSAFIGEVGLGGEVRPVAQLERRLAEAAQLGLNQVWVSRRSLPRRCPDGLEIGAVDTIEELFTQLFDRSSAKRSVAARTGTSALA
ncbi:MAG: DNA repair protein RadA [Gemmatimonadota bacterium]